MEDKELFAGLEEILKTPHERRNAWVSEDKEITPEMKFRNDLGMDSLDAYEFIYTVEEKLGVCIPDEKANEFDSPKDCMDYLRKSNQI